MTTFISADCSIAIPAELLKKAGLQPGQQCDIEIISDDELRVRLRADEGKPEQSLLDWLLACPEKDWFVEPDRSEKTTLEKPTLFDQ